METFLYKYYKKKTRAILTIFEKSKIGLEKEEIHKLRVNIKKVRAIFHWFEIIEPKDFKVHRKDVFTSVYKMAGKIRELQINRNHLTQYNLNPSNALPYKQYASQKEKKLIGTFKKVVDDFNHHQLNKTSKKINRLCVKTNKIKIIKRTNKFINREAKKIKKLYANVDNPCKIHRIRKHLKSLDAIITLLLHTEQNKKIKKLSKSIQHVGILLGAWHDKVVLENSLKNFIKKNKKGAKNKLQPLKKLINRVRMENQQLLKKSSSKINSVLQKIPVAR